jgi:peptide/nickel transport system permease protein
MIKLLKNKKNKISLPRTILLLVLLVGMLSPFLANDQPLIVKENNSYYSPLLNKLFSSKELISDNRDWRNYSGFKIMSPIPYSPGKSDLINADYRSPFDNQFIISESGKKEVIDLRYHHFLGTNIRGADVMAGIISGAGISLYISLLVSILATLIGISLGSIGGLVGNYNLKLNIIGIIASTFILIFTLHINLAGGIDEISSFLKILIFILGLIIIYKISEYQKYLPNKTYSFKIPLENFIDWMTMLFSTIPRLVFIIVIAGFSHPSILNLVLLLTLTSWTDIARIAKTEFIRVNNENYIEAARMTGNSLYRIIRYHIIPNAWPSIAISFCYLVSLNMITESSLSFLGIGLPPTLVSWGSLIAEGRSNLSAWWLIVFPGLLLGICTYALYKITEEIQQ